ncbi:hypothetical protein TorRG33x02_132850 [Trema orientale]|uniref:Uncharacterized protein n=1 Tax=Trema orientale TaxID=63057 RepID=A0A2P5EZB2_TREOI|nr:hypothetical protein TorRG33x02_132850 [Trema orientale]
MTTTRVSWVPPVFNIAPPPQIGIGMWGIVDLREKYRTGEALRVQESRSDKSRHQDVKMADMI